MRIWFTMAVTPSRISASVLSLLLELFVPIMTTATLALMPSSWPFSKRQRTCWVRSPLTPILMHLRWP